MSGPTELCMLDAMRLRQCMCNWSSLRMCRLYGVHASRINSNVGTTMAQFTLILVAALTPKALDESAE